MNENQLQWEKKREMLSDQIQLTVKVKLLKRYI